MTRNQVVPLLLLLVAYVVAGKLGLELAFLHASATPVWPPTGIALAAVLLLGYRVWPVVFVGAFLVNITTAGSVFTSLGIASGNTLEALVGGYLVRRFAGGRAAFMRAADVFRFVLLAGVVATAVSATVGVLTLVLGGLAGFAAAGPIWLTWWVGDAVGAIVVTPAVLLWSLDPRIRWTRAERVEAGVFVVAMLAVTEAVFGGLLSSIVRPYPLEFLCIPLFLWAAFRFGPRESATAVLILAGLAIHGTLLGFGPFAAESPNAALLILQAFIGVVAVATLALSAVVAAQRESEARLTRLAITDPLTGLANYRQLMEVLETEIHRSQRTDRSFTVLFFDLDDLKLVNDRYGHLVGSRALCRLAEAMRRTCRVVDTPGRFGGDEFALILPETEEVAARVVAQRVLDSVARDGEEPALTASVGLAVYPRDATTATGLLGIADRALYRMKRDHHPEFGAPDSR